MTDKDAILQTVRTLSLGNSVEFPRLLELHGIEMTPYQRQRLIDDRYGEIDSIEWPRGVCGGLTAMCGICGGVFDPFSTRHNKICPGCDPEQSSDGYFAANQR